MNGRNNIFFVNSLCVLGTMNPSDRQIAWQEKRVFFLTPQVLTNDLSRGSCSAVAIKCLVVDEAHKALGNHAYCQVCKDVLLKDPVADTI